MRVDRLIRGFVEGERDRKKRRRRLINHPLMEIIHAGISNTINIRCIFFTLRLTNVYLSRRWERFLLLENLERFIKAMHKKRGKRKTKGHLYA